MLLPLSLPPSHPSFLSSFLLLSLLLFFFFKRSQVAQAILELLKFLEFILNSLLFSCLHRSQL